MILSNFTVYIESFAVPPDNKNVVFSVGLIFDASIIDEEIQTIFEQFRSTFFNLFLTPYLIVVGLVLTSETL